MMMSKRIHVTSRPNMRKYGTIYQVEVDGALLYRKDGNPRRFGSAETAKAAGLKFTETGGQTMTSAPARGS